ncbi:MAG: hypothetical protein KA253_00895 [Campylobacteraceae bacterium]|nr:hypothetical protein [Campylobacteraceae bacterium]
MQFLIFITLVAILSIGFFAKKTTLSKKAKMIIILLVGHAIMFAWLYELNNQRVSENNRVVLNAFKQGKTIYCDGIELTSKDFIFVSGTLSFIANDKNQNQKGLVIDISTCKMDK